MPHLSSDALETFGVSFCQFARKYTQRQTPRRHAGLQNSQNANPTTPPLHRNSPLATLHPANKVVDLKAEVSRLKGQLEETESACAKAVSVAEAQRNAAVDRQEELSEDLRRARQASERLTVAEEDAVIAAERDMRAKHDTEVEALRERASKAEERVSERWAWNRLGARALIWYLLYMRDGAPGAEQHSSAPFFVRASGGLLGRPGFLLGGKSSHIFLLGR